MRFDLRQLRYFAAVADELNFTRAADRLSVAQQSLSGAIARLESDIGFRLFERSSRAVALTERGSQWLPHVREVLAAADRAQTAAEDLAAGTTETLSIGLAATAAVDFTPTLLGAFTARHPGIRLLTKHCGLEDPTGGLRDRAADVAIVRPPFASDGLDMIVVAAEPRYAALPAAHPLARRQSFTFDDLAAEPWIEIVASDPVWCAFWRVSDRRSVPPRFGARGRTLDDLLEAARDGRATGVVPASIARSHKWPGLAFVEVSDIPDSEIAVAWNAGRRSPLVRDFIALAAGLRDASRGDEAGRHA
jgi:DNA-binding transcriptional LysR family regulator